ncbi:MAG: family 78 glycoside hydrolase catalytic domain [Clostridia bacterium]|nr:family 78 glycoside hydrolase catalytic domain [Clostridia bacterium]
MNISFQSAKWIWISRTSGADEYGEFFSHFTACDALAVCRISCDGDYTLYINGEYVSSNQYGDFEHYKIYDEIDISGYLRPGNNELSVLVWHFGADFQRCKTLEAGVIFEIEQSGKNILVSDEDTLCRKSSAYTSGYCKVITSQLGFSFLYDATKENLGEWNRSVAVNKECDFYPRPVKRLELLPESDARILKNEGNYYLVDLGKETVGLPVLDFVCDKSQKILVAWGEDLQDGHVRRLLDGRDFSFEYISKPGENKYTNYMLRLGCRYLELWADYPISLNYLGLIEQVYPLKVRDVQKDNLLDKQIHDVCVNTLKLCIMEHYVDTPWREQCLYMFDSRNQMLAGYYAFEDGNFEYARANLLLMSKDRRPDGLLSICYPSGVPLAIPSCSMFYFMAVREYIEHSGDISFGKEIHPKLISIINAFLNNRENGLIKRFGDRTQWNFYDWSEHLEGRLWQSEPAIPDLLINCLFITALENFKIITQKTGEDFSYDEILTESKKRTKEEFFDPRKGAFALTKGGADFTVLGNAFAVLAGISEDPESICEKIVHGDFTNCTFSKRCFKYDALLMTNEKRFKPYVLDEIRRDYKKMLDSGATSVWETADGASAFDNAGSLCHGWSAVALCYL